MRALVIGIIGLLILTSASHAVSPLPGVAEEIPILIENGTIHPVSGPPIQNGSVLIENGKIVFVGIGAPRPAGDQLRRINARGKHVYPGLIEPHSDVGLVEVAAVRSTRDYAEIGSITPNVQARVAINPDSDIIPVLRANGVLLAVASPGGTLLQGQSSMMMLDGWTYEDMTLQAAVGVNLVWPAMGIPRGDRVRTPRDKLIERRQKALEELERAFDEARAYATAKQAAGGRGIPDHLIDSRWEAMLPVLDGRTPLIVGANELRQIQAAVAFAVRQDIRIAIYGGADAPLAADLLRKHEIPVIIDGTLKLPGRRSDPYDTPFTVPEKLRQAGIRFCIGDANRSAHERNLPYQAAMAAAYGLPREVALRAITLSAAEIYGVADRVGSLEVGKDATLFMADGDILEIPTQVELAYIQGREVDLDNKHKVLYRKYRIKYERLGELE